ncbi:hypothetical protein GW17_00039317 [Ensete ventricosum]|nr:hypothetical protein GW17_00039317 [Ensete ventricosum]
MRAWVEFDHTMRNPVQPPPSLCFRNSRGGSRHRNQEAGNPPHTSRRVRTGGYRHGDY